MFQHIKSFVQAGSILIPNWEVTESRHKAKDKMMWPVLIGNELTRSCEREASLSFSIALIHVIVSYVFLVYQMTSTSQYMHV